MATTGQTQSSLCFNLIAIIADGEDTSNNIDLAGTTFLGFITPDNLTGTVFTFLGSSNGEDFFPYYDAASGTALTTGSLTSSTYYGFSALNFAPVRWLKIVSNSSQTGDANIIIVSRALT